MHREQVCCSFWRDDSVLALSRDATLLYIYLLTCEESHGLSGVYVWSRFFAAACTKLTSAELDLALQELVDAGKVRIWPNGYIWVVNRARWQVHSAAQVKGCQTHIFKCPAEIRQAFMQRYGKVFAQILKGEGHGETL